MLTGHETLQQAVFSCLELTFVPVCSHQAGKGRHDAHPTLVLPGCIHALTLPRGCQRLSTGQIWARWDSHDHRNQELTAFPFCLEKTQGQAQEQKFAASQLETAAIWYAGERKGLTRLQRYMRGSTGFCVRGWTGTGGSALLQRLGTLFAQQTWNWGWAAFSYFCHQGQDFAGTALAPVCDIVIRAVRDPNCFHKHKMPPKVPTMWAELS